MTNIPRPRGLIAHLGKPAQHVTDGHQQLIQRSGLIQPNIHRALHRLGRLQRLHQHLDQIGNVEKIARLLAIAEHRNRQPLLRPLGEDADHTGIR